MRYASTFDQSGAPVVAELQGDLLVPLAGLTELGAATTAEVLAAAGRRAADAFPAAEAELRPVVPNPAKVICVGLNYKAHIEETGRSDSDYPVLFPKFASSLAGPFATLDLPAESDQIDYEGELTIVIGGPGRRDRRGRRGRPRPRLHHRQRRLHARLPVQDPPVDAGQGVGRLHPGRPVPGHGR